MKFARILLGLAAGSALMLGATASISAQELCTNTCATSNDNECDDGGPNSLYSICGLGTDCNDCGPRTVGQTCTDTCETAHDGECDDGGPNSLYSICEYGSDCADCGPR